MFLLLPQPAHRPCPDPPPWSACLDSLLDLSVPLEWGGASLCLGCDRGSGPGEVVEPSPCAHGDRLYLLHGTRYPHGPLPLIFSIFSAIIVHWSCNCCRQIWRKLLYILFNLLGIPCVVLGFLAVWMWKDRAGKPHLYSIHSWLGLVTMGLAVLQVRQPASHSIGNELFISVSSWGDQLSSSSLLPVSLLQTKSCHGPHPL